MASKKITSNKDKGLPQALIIGLLTGIVVSLAGVSLLAYLIESESIDISGMKAGCIVIHLVGAALSGLAAYSVMKRQRVIVCAISTLCYFLMQVGMTAMFFGGQYQGIGAGILAIVGGGVLSILPGFISRGSGGKRLKMKAFR